MLFKNYNYEKTTTMLFEKRRNVGRGTKYLMSYLLYVNKSTSFNFLPQKWGEGGRAWYRERYGYCRRPQWDRKPEHQRAFQDFIKGKNV